MRRQPLQISVHKTVCTNVDIEELNEGAMLDSPYIQHVEHAVQNQDLYEDKGEDRKTAVGR